MRVDSNQGWRAPEEDDTELEEALADAQRRLDETRALRATLMNEQAQLAARFERLVREIESLWDASPQLAALAGFCLGLLLGVLWLNR